MNKMEMGLGQKPDSPTLPPQENLEKEKTLTLSPEDADIVTHLIATEMSKHQIPMESLNRMNDIHKKLAGKDCDYYKDQVEEWERVDKMNK